ncbi:hypothetical protein MOX02_32690 [Methylobacterium oxalidis]|uniref:Uncharacterized protein n=1 Tax=Methylobacterium oxalidis TaxID=944322 RepID=A0A512J5H7_9HYPH|nr:hypothetical protein MOX02_32690 [Methylobacterium oxalidis]GLS66351.1 hypothetical protein GCM10007888_47340 [Methylobacterium oxalidis]
MAHTSIRFDCGASRIRESQYEEHTAAITQLCSFGSETELKLMSGGLEVTANIPITVGEEVR